MNRFFKIAYILSIILIGVSSCSLEKRIYRKGYHVVWNAKHSNDFIKQQDLKVEKQNTINLQLVDEDVVFANANRESDIVTLKRRPVLILNNDTCGDVLLLQSADELKVKILEIDEQTIKYKRCDNLNGPTFSISKSKVALIKYANGTKEVVMQESPSKTVIQRNSNAPEAPRKVNLLGLSSLLLYILGIILSSGLTGAGLSASLSILLVILSIAPLVMAYISLFQFKREPERYKGRWMPLTVVCLYLALLLLLALAIAAVGAAYGGGSGVGIAVGFFLFLFFVFLGILIAALIPKAQPKTRQK